MQSEYVVKCRRSTQSVTVGGVLQASGQQQFATQTLRAHLHRTDQPLLRPP